MNRRTTAVAAGVVGVLVLSACSGMTAAAEVAQAPESEQTLEIWQRKAPCGPSDRIGQALVASRAPRTSTSGHRTKRGPTTATSTGCR